MGAPKDRLGAARAAYDKPIEVHPENWTAVQVFRLCTTPQVGTFAGLATVQVSAVEMAQAAAAYGVTLTPELIHAVRIMGSETARVHNQKLAEASRGAP